LTNWLLLHGTPLTPAVWDGVIPLLGAAAAPSVIHSDRTGPHLQAGIAAELAARSHAVPPPWHVVGHSFGGQVALELAIQRPDRVSALTLLCTRDTPYPPFGPGAEAVAHDRVDIDRVLRRWFGPKELADDGFIVRYARRTLLNADRVCWAAALAAISTFDCSTATPSIKCPTLVLAAEHDDVCDPPTVTAMHGRLAGSELVVINDASHMSVFTDPDRLARLLNR
jgi:3-oxoadipate enol-lactonase